MTRERIALLAVILAEAAVFLADLFLAPGLVLPAAPYAAPILIGALYLPPLLVAAITAGTLALELLAALIQGTFLVTWPLFLVGVAITGTLATLLADRRARLTASLAEQARLAEQEADARAVAEQRATELEALRQVTDPFLARQGLEELVESLLQRTVAIMGADAGSIMLLDPTGQVLELKMTVGIPGTEITGGQVRVGEDFVGKVIKRNAVTAVSDVQETPEYHSDTIRGSAIRGLMGTPLPVRGQVIGALHVGFRQAKQFEPSEELLLSVVAERVAQAIDQTRLLEEARSAQRQTAQSLEAEHQARRRAEEAIRARDAFLAAAAHELKTPITSLRGYAQVTMRRLQREGAPDPERTRQALSTIDRQSDRLARLVAQLLDVASIEAGQLKLHRQCIDLVPVVRSLVESVGVAQRHKLTLQAPPSLQAMVDRERIENLVANLLDNAVKYSPPDTSVEIELAAPSPDRVQLAVRDHGPGIPPERRSQLFSRFFQAQAERPFAGLGLGLFYSRSIVELHGGQIHAEFPPEGGSRFVVTLPSGALAAQGQGTARGGNP